MSISKLRVICLGLALSGPSYAMESPAVLHLELTVDAAGRVTQCKPVGITGRPRSKVDVQQQCRVQSSRWFRPDSKRRDGKAVRGNTIVVDQLLDAIR